MLGKSYSYHYKPHDHSLNFLFFLRKMKTLDNIKDKRIIPVSKITVINRV
jgi:hypothetical protein